MYCCSAQESKMDYKRRFLLGGSKQKVQQHQQYQMPELGRTLSAPLASGTPSTPLVSPAAAGGCSHPASHTTPIADIQQGISKYLDALNVFCRTSTFLTDLFSSVFRNSHYSKAAMQLKDVQEHVMEAASRLTAAIKPEIAKMLMELSAGAANFKDQKEFSLQDIEVSYLGGCCFAREFVSLLLNWISFQNPFYTESLLCLAVYLWVMLVKKETLRFLCTKSHSWALTSIHVKLAI